MGLKLSNNAVSRLASGITNSETTISLTPGGGALFPALSAGEWFPATIVKADGTLEIVRVTARSTDVLTVTRAQENTTATAFNAGDLIELRMTAGAIQEIISLFASALPLTGGTLTGSLTVQGDVTLGAGKKIILEGATDDTFETIIDAGNPTAGRTLTLPDKSGTLATTDDIPTIVDGSITTAKIADANVTAAKLASGAAVSNIGYTPVNKAGDSMTAPLEIAASAASSQIRLKNTGTNGKTFNMFSTDSAFPTSQGAGKLIAYHPDAGVSYLFGTDSAGNFSFNSGFGSAAVAYGCRAWVNFNGTGTTGQNQTINGGGNVASVYKNNTGEYTLTFTNAMPHTNYGVFITISGRYGSGYFLIGTLKVKADNTGLELKSTTQVRIYTGTGGGNPVDIPDVNVFIIA